MCRLSKIGSRRLLIAICMVLLTTTWAAHAQEADGSESPAEAPTEEQAKEPVTPAEAQTTDDPEVPVDVLSLRLEPLTKDELVVEAEAWLAIAKKKVTELTQAEIEVKKQASAIKKSEEGAEGDSPPEGAADDATESTGEKKKVKQELLDLVTRLREERVASVDRFNAVIDALEAKGGKVDDYRLYVKAVSGVKVDVSDTEAAIATILGWLKSEEGGIRWAINVGKFLAIVVAFVLLGWFLGHVVDKALRAAGATSELLHRFLVRAARRATIIVGIIVGLTALEVNVGPLLAVIGATGFVVGFALQSTLSNFASGLMIMLYRPFDIGDAVDVAGINGKVEGMSLVNTKILTWDNQVMVVPNNSIWGDIITNVTGSATRRVDMVFGIGYDDDIKLANKILEEIASEHPLTLDDPAPTVQLNELGDSSINFICRPWAKTSDYWSVYWDVTRTVKERFDAAGISIPFPQRDIHVHHVASGAPEALAASTGKDSDSTLR